MPTIQPFHRVYVDYMVIGESSRVSWELDPKFVQAPFMSFQLQANRNADEPDAWVNVGDPVINQLYAFDSEQRQFGQSLRINYRVILTMPDSTVYISDNARVLGNLTKHQWLIAKAIARRGPLKAKSMHSYEGWLMRRRIQGPYCDCVDPITKGIQNSNHPRCFGTGRVGGYWNAAQLKMFDMSPETENTRTDPRLMTGTKNIGSQQVTGRCVGIPLPQTRDIWIDAHSGRRYYVEEVVPEHEINRVPILVALKLAMAEFSDVVYQLPIGLDNATRDLQRAGKDGPEVWKNQGV